MKFLVSFSGIKCKILVHGGCFWGFFAKERRPKCKLNNYRRSSTKAQWYRYVNNGVNRREIRICVLHVKWHKAWHTLWYCEDVWNPLLSIQSVKSETTRGSHLTSVLKFFKGCLVLKFFKWCLLTKHYRHWHQII